MTAYAATALVHDGKLDPGIDLLPKPFTRDVLANRVRELLDRARPVQANTRILVVEDEVLVRMYLTQVLGELGCTVEEAGSFKQARVRLAALGDSLGAAIVDSACPTVRATS